jgi:hypothetical protein
MVEIITQHLPGAVAQALMAALSTIPSERLTCWGCFQRKRRWDNANPGAIRAAVVEACDAKGLDPDDPQATAQVSFAEMLSYLPEELQHDPADPLSDIRLPMVYEGLTMAGGNIMCELDAAWLSDQGDAEAAHRAEMFHAAQMAAQDPAPQAASQAAQQGAPQLLQVRPGVDIRAAAQAARTMPGLPGAPVG